jgi:hypothetical protein
VTTLATLSNTTNMSHNYMKCYLSENALCHAQVHMKP